MNIIEFIKNVDARTWAIIGLTIALVVSLVYSVFYDDEDKYEDRDYD